MSKATITIRVEASDKIHLQKQARLMGSRSLSEYLCEHILKNVLPDIEESQPSEPLEGRNFSIRTRVTAAEKALFVAKCRAEKLTESALLRRQVRILLSQEADFAGEELTVLRDTNAQLRAIGNNLNQVTVRVRSAKGAVQVNEGLLKSLLERVLLEKKSVGALIRRSKMRLLS